MSKNPVQDQKPPSLLVTRRQFLPLLGATAASVSAARDVLAVGFAFAGQEFETVPHDENDQRLDWVVTENGARRFDW